MKSSHQLPRDKDRGFALVVTLSMMILLTVIAVGLLSLSSISLRKTSADNANHVARANARLALMLALGELQKAAGPDQRVTADRSLLNPNAGTDTNNPNALGVWKGWSPRFAEPPTASTPANINYATQKTNTQFVGWLTSNATAPTANDLLSPSWATNGSLADPVQLFTEESDGFYQAGSKVQIQPGTAAAGSMAWTIVQEGTKAKINVAGPEAADVVDKNDALQAQARPSLEKSDDFKQPDRDWNVRASKVLSISQAKLDDAIWRGNATIPEAGDFTTSSMGLLTDVVYGGLKTDMNLGFEMSDSNFDAVAWGDYKNPFRAGGIRNSNAPPSTYRSQRPLFKILSTGGINPNMASTKVTLTFNPASTSFTFPAAAAPTFTTLRSFYRTPYYMYSTSDGPTIFERGMDHIALTKPVAAAIPNPGASPPANATQTGYRPVLDRIIYFLSVGLENTTTAEKRVTLIYTPIITLWNPYNVALEIEGAVACPWLDMPFNAACIFPTETKDQGMSHALGNQFMNVNHGRTIKPYFFAAITKTGSPNVSAPIRFLPGEVRVFAPASTNDVAFNSDVSAGLRTVYLKPVDNPNQISVRGGLAIPMKGVRAMKPSETVQMNFTPSTASPYPFAVCLEDATRVKVGGSNPPDNLRGQAISDVQTVNFASGSIPGVLSPTYSFTTLLNPATRQPFAAIETYHRVAQDVAISRRSDIVYTTNPRQAYVNRYLSDGDFKAGPHYETVVKPASNIAAVFQTINNGRNALYGQTNSTTGGESQLAFFEAPQQPIISLAALQHADLSGTSYSSANQIGNSWASAYVPKNTASRPISAGGGGTGDATYTRDAMPAYDYSYLANEALWDSFFFSSITPTVQMPSRTNGTPTSWNSPNSTKTSLKDTLSSFIDDPAAHPLRNSRMKFYTGKETPADLKTSLLNPEACVRIAAHLQVDGAFNINSTSVKAWIALLSGMRDADFAVTGGSAPAGGKTAFPRFRNPMGSDSNKWNGFRSLSDSEISSLANRIVTQVRDRGPFLSLGEFVNRRVDNTNMALKGALQAAIDDAGLNSTSLYDKFDINLYPAASRSNVTTPNTGVGVPGYLTQADVLQSIAPVITARSDTFTIRAYGEAKDKSGKVLATARCEAVVQRMPEYCDEANPADTQIIPVSAADLTPSNLTPTNIAFGRKFAIVSFRYLSDSEVVL